MNNLSDGNDDLPSGYLDEAWDQEAAATATARPIPETWMLQTEASGLNYDGWMLGEKSGSTHEVRRRDTANWANWSVYDTWMPEEVVAGSSPEKNPRTGIDSIKKKRKGTPWTEHEHR